MAGSMCYVGQVDMGLRGGIKEEFSKKEEMESNNFLKWLLKHICVSWGQRDIYNLL